MAIFIIFLVALLCLNVKFNKFTNNGECFNAFDRDQTTSIKGIFALLIFFSHVRGYISISGAWYNIGYNFILDQLYQLIVVMFFFYSGYGIIKSFKSKPKYFGSFPKNRILTTWIHLIVCVLIFLLIQLCLSKEYSASTILLAFTGWTSLGNSNWFMFIILVLYLITWLLSLVIKNDKMLGVCMALCTLAFVISISFIKEPWWYNTMLAYPFGMIIASHQEKLEHVCVSTTKRWATSSICSLIIFFGLFIAYRFFNPFELVYNMLSCTFAVVIVLITYKVRFINKPLIFFGKHSFAIYMLQRLPMILLALTPLTNIPVLFTLVCLIITIGISVGFDIIMSGLDNFIRGNKKVENTTK